MSYDLCWLLWVCVCCVCVCVCVVCVCVYVCVCMCVCVVVCVWLCVCCVCVCVCTLFYLPSDCGIHTVTGLATACLPDMTLMVDLVLKANYLSGHNFGFPGGVYSVDFCHSVTRLAITLAPRWVDLDFCRIVMGLATILASQWVALCWLLSHCNEIGHNLGSPVNWPWLLSHRNETSSWTFFLFSTTAGQRAPHMGPTARGQWRATTSCSPQVVLTSSWNLACAVLLLSDVRQQSKVPAYSCTPTIALSNSLTVTCVSCSSYVYVHCFWFFLIFVFPEMRQRNLWCLPSCLESQGCQFDPTFL